MANISSVSSSSSLYGSKNILSGLASGLDTESMIANSVSGYKAKITALQQKQTILQWKQDAYRSITDKMVALSRKYTSYTSSTNLSSPSFFNRAVTTTPNGSNASAVSASNKTSSSVQINSITALASAAKYSVSASSLAGGGTVAADGKTTITASQTVDLNSALELSQISGSMTINYGGSKSVTIDFGPLETFNSVEEIADAINTKLSNQNISNSEGGLVAANKLINVSVSGDTISFSDLSGAQNSVYISSASESMQTNLGITPGTDAKSFTVDDVSKLTNPSGTRGEYLSGKTINFTLDGVTKSIKLPTYQGDATSFVQGLQDSLNAAFGQGKITLDTNQTDANLNLSFTIGQGSTLSIDSSVGSMLGLGETSLTSYLNTSSTLGQMVDLSTLTADENGLYSFVLNGVEIGKFSKDTTLESILLAINSNTEAGVSASYSRMTNQFTFTAKDTGATGRIEFGAAGGTAQNDLAMKMFGTGGSSANPVSGFTAGSDATFNVTINGTTMDLTRSSNVVDLDGLSVTLKSTFSDGDPITFTSKTDADTIINAIKSFVEDFNAMASEIREAYNTQPARKSTGATYSPLTDDDKANMTESAIKAYEEKAKQGLLFADSDLSTLYNKLRSVISGSGSDGATMRSIGLTTSYSQGITTLSLDESALRDALERNSDQVKDIFTKTIEGGASTNGLIQNLKNTLDAYASTSVATPGILVRKAGTKLSSLSLLNNTLQKNIDTLNTQIENWQTKMSSRIDYYTKKFTALEKLISQMNSQSSYLSELSGGY